MSSHTVRKEVSHPLIPRTRVKTRVESSLSQVPVSSSAQGSSRSFDFIPQSPLGPFGRTRSRQKTIGESVERERRTRPISFFSLLFCNSSLLLLCLSLSLSTDEWLFFPYSPNVSQTPREARASHLAMMWYAPLLFVPFSICFHSFPIQCTYTFCDVLPLAFLFLLQVEVPPPMIGRTLV